ncbi:MAG: putative type secretion system protein [Pedosphaera sp.]|nr:putative type secretion system protein [Pedosphaera sp.]
MKSMKTIKPILPLAVLMGGLFHAAAQAPAQPATATTAQEAGTNNDAADFAADKGLRMNFRGVTLETVLSYMSKAAGFIIHPTSSVDVKGKVDVWSEQPLSKDEAVALLKQILNENGYTAIQDGRTLTIVRSEDAKRKDIPIKVARTFDNIPKNADIVTEIIPVRTLNPVQLLKDLGPLLPSGTTLTANESANSLVMTDTQANIRRIAEIIAALDSVSSTVNSIRVIPLKYADAKTVAGLVKDIFSPQDSSSRTGGNGGGGNAFRFPGGFPGFPGGDQGGGSAESSGQTPSLHVVAVADDHGNSVVISAPESLMTIIDQTIRSIDVSVEDVTAVEVFHLKNADPTEMSDLLSSLFSDDSSSVNSSQFQFGGRGGGGGGGAFGPVQMAVGNSNSSSDKSDRTKKMGKVTAVADRRTSSLIVSASRNLMPQISAMINKLDENPANIQHVYFVALKNADPMDVQQVLQNLFPAGNNSSSSSSSSTQNNPLTTRSQTLLNSQFNSTGTTTGSGSSSSGSKGF